ncbi:glycosyltransferase family 2 protein, partial [Lactobacillus helveticus]
MGYKLSVIVPVYNKEQYIDSGLSSLLHQTLISNMEIIIIDDGSNHRTGERLKKFCQKHRNFKYFYEKNKGVSAARNFGLRMANAELVGFFDIDDYVEPAYFQNLVNEQEKYNSDITISDFEMYFSDGSKKKHRPVIEKYWDKRINMLKDFFAGNYVGNNVVDKIFKKTIVEDITFPEGYAVGEDMYFVYEAIQNSRSMYLNSSLSGYHYIFREKSAMTSKFNSKFYDPVKLSQRMLDDNKGSLKEYAYVHLIHEKCKLLENMLKNNGVGENREVYKQYRKDIRKINIINAFKILNKKQFLGLILMSI